MREKESDRKEGRETVSQVDEHVKGGQLQRAVVAEMKSNSYNIVYTNGYICSIFMYIHIVN